MSEDMGLCTDVKHHKSKIALFFYAMRSYRDVLVNNGYNVHYMDINNKFSLSYITKLKEYIEVNKILISLRAATDGTFTFVKAYRIGR